MAKFYERILAAILHPDRTTCLPLIADLLNLGGSNVEALKKATPAERERMFASLIESDHGGALDWRGDVYEIYALLKRILGEEQYASLPSPDSISDLSLKKRIFELSHSLKKYDIALRLIESTGDHYYLLIVPVALVHKFDEIAKKWALG